MILGKHALVLGASMAGLLAARVLADRFEQVTLVERDLLPPEPAARKGVPQGVHVHGFYARGLDYVERLLPGVKADLHRAGAMTGDIGRNFVWHQFDHLKLRDSVGISATVMSRILLEGTIRRHLARHPRIRFEAGQIVQRLRSQGTRIVGVDIAPGAGNGPARALDADLVVDATGRAGHAVRWLEAMGYPRPPESRVSIGVRYTTRYFRRTDTPETIGHIVVATPPAGRRAGVCFAIEGDRWLVTLVGFMNEVPPTDPAGFLSYAQSLPYPSIGEIVRGAEPIGDPHTFKFPANLRRHYEKLRAFPAGMLVVGDALASFNPAYGQGMTVAACEAEALEDELARAGSTDGLARRFFKRAARIIDNPWMLTTGEDLRYPDAEGKRPPGLAIINRYATRVHHRASYDPAVCRAFFEVASLRKGPPSLFAPRIAARVLRPSRTAPPANHGASATGRWSGA